MQAVIVLIYKSSLASLVPKSIKKLVSVLFALRSLNDRIQVLFRNYTRYLLTETPHLYINQLFPCLNRLVELKVEAPTHKNDLNEDNVDHVEPSDTVAKIKGFRVVRNVPNFEKRFIVFLFELIVLLYGFFGVIPSLNYLKIGVKNQKCGRCCKHGQHEDEIFEEKVD